MSEYFLCIFIKGTRGNSRELDDTRGNSRELKGTWVSSREALVEVIEGKKLRKRGQRGEISQIRQEEKRKHRSALRALNILNVGFHDEGRGKMSLIQLVFWVQSRSPKPKY